MVSTRLSYRVATVAALVLSALAVTPLGASARPAGVGTSSSLRSPAWMRHAPTRPSKNVSGLESETELPGAANPSEPYAAASQAVYLYRRAGQPTSRFSAPTTSVNPVTGVFSLSLGDLFVPERGVPLELSLTYNSYFASKAGPFGRGWSFNAGMTLTRASDGSVSISQENGSQVTFQHTSQHYSAAPHVIASLREVSHTFVFTRGTRGTKCPSYSRSCVKFFFSEPVAFAPGRLTKIASPDGGLTLVYKAHRLTAVQDPVGRTLSFEYKNGKVNTTALDADGPVVHTTCDTHGNLTRFTKPGGGSLGFLYDAYHRLTGIVDPRGAETHIVYDAAGHVQSITDPTGETDFSRAPAQTSVSRPGGAISTAHYAERVVTRIDEGDPAAPLATTLISYDPATLGPTAVTNPDGHTTHMSYDALGHLTSFTDPLGHTSTYHFAAATRIITARDPLGNVSQATTDATGRLVSIAVDSSDAALTQTTTFHYGNSAHPGDVTAVSDPEGKLWRFAYDKFGNPTRLTDPLGNTSSEGYDRLGRPTVNTAGTGNVAGADPDAFSTTYTYDPEGRMLSSTDPLGNTESFSYDLDGNLVATVAGGHQTSYSYDAAGRLTAVYRPMHHAQGELVYRSDGHVGEVCDGGNNCEEYTYDDLGRRATVTDPLGNTSSFAYSPGGLLLSSTDANGVTTSYSHDAAGQTTGISYSDGVTPPVTFEYDAAGRNAITTNAITTNAFTYDSLGRVKREVNGLGMESDYAYDRLDHVTSMELNSTPMASYTYDHAGRMASVKDRLGNTTTFSYDASSNLIQTLFPGGDVDRDGYDNAGRLVHFSLSDSTSDPASIDIAYKRNLLGQITGATQTGTGQPSQAYGYDANGRLSRVARAAVNYVPNVFDERDNLLQNAAGDTFTYDAADRLVSEDQKDITPDVNWQFGYDHNGSRTSAVTLDGTRSQDFVWDAAGNLTSFTDGSSSETNTYDGLGREVSSSAGGTSHRYIWDSRSQVWSSLRGVWGTGPSDLSIFGAIGQDARLARTALRGRAVVQGNARFSGPLADGSTTFIYGPEGLPVEQIDGSGDALFYHHDQLGSTRAVTDATGHTVEIVAYDEFGNRAYHSGSVNVPFGFGGGYTDPVSHLVLMGHDYYDPPTGQFLERELSAAQWEVANGGADTARIRRAITVGQNAPVLLRSGNPALLSVELFFDTYEKGTALGATGSPSALDVELIFDGYEEQGRYAQNGGVVVHHVARRVLTGGYAWNACDCDSSVAGAERPTSTIGSSPYALGGGDPINGRVWRSRSGHAMVLDDNK